MLLESNVYGVMLIPMLKTVRLSWDTKVADRYLCEFQCVYGCVFVCVCSCVCAGPPCHCGDQGVVAVEHAHNVSCAQHLHGYSGE
jgi:hypothetical protein